MLLRKSPHVIVISNNISSYELICSKTSKRLNLSDSQTNFWKMFNDSWKDSLNSPFLKQLQEHGFIEFSKVEKNIPMTKFDSVVPRIAGKYARHHHESSDLTVLFNTANLTINNPLLVLGAYGTQIWNSILNGQTIYEIRKKVLQLFGEDEVLPFLNRLGELGFIENIQDISTFGNNIETIRKEFQAPYVQSLLKCAKQPWYCLWEICSKCNLRCQNCYLPKFSSNCPSFSTILGIAEQLIKQGVFYVTILGGEPLLVHDLENVIKQLRDKGVFVKVISNGKNFTKASANLLVKANLNQFEVSFDGLTAESHDKSRGKNSFFSALEAVSIAKDAGISRVGIVLTVYHENFHELTSLPTFMDRLGVKECYISLFRKIGLNGEKSTSTPIKIDRFKVLEKKIEEFSLNYPHLTISVTSNCTCGKTSIVIGEEGNVRPCPFKNTVVGNVFNESFQLIWSDLNNRIPSHINLKSPEYCRLSIK